MPSPDSSPPAAPSSGENTAPGPTLTRRRIVLFTVLLTVLPLVLLLALGEAALRLLDVDTETVKSKHFSVEMPMWLMEDTNFLAMSGPAARKKRRHTPEELEWMVLFEEDRWVQYKLKPNVDAWVVNSFSEPERGKNVRWRIHSNDRGFRASPVKPPAAEGERSRLILALGDSSTFGWGVDWEWSYVARIAEHLGEASPGATYRVANLAMPGYTSAHARAMWTSYGRAFRPEIVVIGVGANDPRQGLVKAADLIARGHTPLAALKAFLHHSKLYLALRRWIFQVYDPFDRVAEKRRAGGVETGPIVSRQEYRENLEFLLREAAGRGAATVLVGICSPKPYRNVMADVARKAGVPYVDAHALFARAVPALQRHEAYQEWVDFYEKLYGLETMKRRQVYYVSTDGCHPNPIGADLIGREVARRLRGESTDAGAGLTRPGGR